MDNNISKWGLNIAMGSLIGGFFLTFLEPATPIVFLAGIAIFIVHPIGWFMVCLGSLRSDVSLKMQLGFWASLVGLLVSDCMFILGAISSSPLAGFGAMLFFLCAIVLLIFSAVQIVISEEKKKEGSRI